MKRRKKCMGLRLKMCQPILGLDIRWEFGCKTAASAMLALSVLKIIGYYCMVKNKAQVQIIGFFGGEKSKVPSTPCFPFLL
jgi:hypothetical protein